MPGSDDSRSFPPPPPLPAKVRLFQRTPPAIFPPILGLFGLGIAWRRGAGAFGMPAGVVEAFLGAVTLLFIFALVAYGVKFVRRPGVWREDLRTLPGRTGLSAMTMCAMLLAAVLVFYAPALAEVALWAGIALHAVTALAVLKVLIRSPETAGPRTPALHLVFVGFIVAPAAMAPLGHAALIPPVAWYCLIAALAIYAPTLPPLLTGREPPPLRPLQAIHLAPAALLATAGFLGGQPVLGQVMLAAATLLFAVLVLRARWMTEAGFSGFWSAFTFPIAAYAGAWFAASGTLGWAPAPTVGGVVLVAATLMIPPIAFRVMQLWAKGTLAAKTNAAIA